MLQMVSPHIYTTEFSFFRQNCTNGFLIPLPQSAPLPQSYDTSDSVVPTNPQLESGVNFRGFAPTPPLSTGQLPANRDAHHPTAPRSIHQSGRASLAGAH